MPGKVSRSSSPKSPASTVKSFNTFTSDEDSGQDWLEKHTITTQETKGRTFQVKVEENHGPVTLTVTNSPVGLDPCFVPARLQLRSTWGFTPSTVYLGLSTVPDDTKVGKNGRKVEYTQLVDAGTAVEKLRKHREIADHLESKAALVCKVWNERNSSADKKGSRSTVSAEYMVKERRHRNYTGGVERTQCMLRIDSYLVTNALQNTSGSNVCISPKDLTISLKYRSTANRKSRNLDASDPKDKQDPSDMVFDYHGLSLSAPAFVKLLRSEEFEQALELAEELQVEQWRQKDKELMNEGIDPSSEGASSSKSKKPKLTSAGDGEKPADRDADLFDFDSEDNA